MMEWARLWIGRVCSRRGRPFQVAAGASARWHWAGDEGSKRIELWERSEFEALLRRCEQKLGTKKYKKRKHQPPRDDAAGRGDRAAHGCTGGLPEGHLRPGVIHGGDE